MSGYFGICSSESHIDSILKGVAMLRNKNDANSVKQHKIHPFELAHNFLSTQYIYGNNEKLHCWVFGQINNLEELKSFLSAKEPISLSELFLLAKIQNKLDPFLAKVDGIYSSIILNISNQQLEFITDRLGLATLYIATYNKNILWSDQVKCFLADSLIPLQIDSKSAHSFVANGQLMDDQSWIDGVKRLGPAMRRKYSLDTNKVVEEQRYWSWNNIRPLNVSFDDAANHVDYLFNLAVTKRVSSTDDATVALSGGLDSRYIISKLSDIKRSISAFTFGSAEASDIKIAQKICAELNVDHQTYILTEKNWLSGRAQCLWNGECGTSLLHAHIGPFLNDLQKKNKISFNGFAGDLVLGGSWIGKLEPKTKQNNTYLNEDIEDSYHIYNRVRRFTMNGIDIQKNIISKLPFMDNDLLEFVYGLPDSYRKKYKLYNHILLSKHHSLFASFPHGNTPYLTTNIFVNKYHALLNLLSKKTNSILNFNALVEAQKKSLINFISSNNSIVNKIINLDSFKYSTLKLMRLLSLEIWLNQICNGSLKSDSDISNLFNNHQN